MSHLPRRPVRQGPYDNCRARRGMAPVSPSPLGRVSGHLPEIAACSAEAEAARSAPRRSSRPRVRPACSGRPCPRRGAARSSTWWRAREWSGRSRGPTARPGGPCRRHGSVGQLRALQLPPPAASSARCPLRLPARGRRQRFAASPGRGPVGSGGHRTSPLVATPTDSATLRQAFGCLPSGQSDRTRPPAAEHTGPSPARMTGLEEGPERFEGLCGRFSGAAAEVVSGHGCVTAASRCRRPVRVSRCRALPHRQLPGGRPCVRRPAGSAAAQPDTRCSPGRRPHHVSRLGDGPSLPA